MIEITGMAHGGDGVGRLEGKAVRSQVKSLRGKVGGEP